MNTRSCAPLILLSCLTLLAFSCDKKTPATDKATTPAATKNNGADAKTTQKTKTQPQSLAQLIESTAQECTLDQKSKVNACKPLRSIKKILGKQRMKAFPEIVNALTSKNEKTEYVAAYLLKNNALYFMKDAAKKDYTIRAEDKRANPIDKTTAKKLIEHVQGYDVKTQTALLKLTAEAAMDAATLGDMNDEAKALLKKFDPQASAEQKELHRMVAKRSMLYTRMSLFDVAQSYHTHPIKDLQPIAFEAPQMMQNWNAEESNTICTWASSMMSKKEVAWNTAPARLLLRCNDANTWRNVLLDEATRRYNTKELDRSFANVLCRICAPAVHQVYPAGGKTVCARGEALFLKFTEDATNNLDISTRQTLMKCLPEQWQSKTTIEHLQHLTKDQNPQINTLATELFNKYAPKNMKK